MDSFLCDIIFSLVQFSIIISFLEGSAAKKIISIGSQSETRTYFVIVNVFNCALDFFGEAQWSPSRYQNKLILSNEIRNETYTQWSERIRKWNQWKWIQWSTSIRRLKHAYTDAPLKVYIGSPANDSVNSTPEFDVICLRISPLTSLSISLTSNFICLTPCTFIGHWCFDYHY